MKAPFWERVRFWLCDTFGHGRTRDPWTGPLGRRFAICDRCARIVHLNPAGGPAGDTEE